MGLSRFAASGSLAALGLMLAACGGGGVNSTPTPTPTGGTPTPTPTGGTPTPTPTGGTPTPTSAVNDDLVAPLVSESFTNDAVTGTANYTLSGYTAAAARSTLSVQYNASNQTYTVTSGNRSQAFRPSDKDGTLSSATATAYVRTSGNTTDSLYLTNATVQQATPSNLRFRYVGGGVWQRTIEGNASASGSIDAFAYGVETSDAALPKTGSAHFAVDIQGVVALPHILGSIRGDGELAVNFSTGAITGGGQANMRSPVGDSFLRTWGVSANISSTSNSFSGAFGMGEESVINGANAMTGSIAGRFYGPNAEELGASWHWRDNVSGETYVGFLLGTDGSLFPVNTSLRQLVVSEDFIDDGYVYRTRIDSSTGINYNSGEPNPHPGTGTAPNVYFDENTGSLVIDDFPGMTDQPLLPADRDAGLSNSTYDVYAFTTKAANGNTAEHTVKVFRPADSNPVIALSYTSFAAWTYRNLNYATYYDVDQGWVAFGQATPANAVPKSGSATYSAAIFGQSDIATAANGTQRSYEISGTGRFQFNFGTGALSGWLHPLMRDPTTSSSYDLGQYDFADTTYTSGSQVFYGSFANTSAYPYSDHDFQGQFTGPAAQELEGRWRTATIDPVTSRTLDIFGIVVGKQN